MPKIRPMLLLVCAAVAVGGAGCTQPSVKPPTITLDALAKQLGVSSTVLALALRSGYNPEIEDGKTVFCLHGEQTGSMVPTRSCVDAARLQIELQTRQQFVDDVHGRVQQSVDTPRPGSLGARP